ncbi:MAG: hypothetical protein COA81_00260 [Alphaproteobacteria bacterium]|nr:MAG: hypothetical protein COA81_00260 [Alphaproteobacteria bacterium]
MSHKIHIKRYSQNRQDDLFRPRLENLIDPRHELVKLALIIDRDGWNLTFPAFTARIMVVLPDQFA